MVGKVSGYLRGIIKRQVDDKGIVVRYDPEGHYQQFVKSLDLPGTPLEKHDGSFFALRHRIDTFLSSSDPPRLIVYVPLDRSLAHNALVEAEAAEDETTFDFIVPPWSVTLNDTLTEIWLRDDVKGNVEKSIDEEVYRLYGISDEDRKAIESELSDPKALQDRNN